MKITADTNLLLRLFVHDDDRQRKLAKEALVDADLVAVSVHALCELSWVMGRSHSFTNGEVATAIRVLMNTGNVVLNRPAVEAGLRMLDVGGDFADGVIAFDGQWLGGETFVSFDRKAVKLLQKQGGDPVLLG
ncbi:MAG: type II toxin-antitoxin system VapC family toxin [Novosphingobium sp.]